MNNGKHGKGTHCTKLGDNSLAKNTPQMPQNLSAQFDCPSPKVLDFNEKRLYWASVVRASITKTKPIKTRFCHIHLENLPEIDLLSRISIANFILVINIF